MKIYTIIRENGGWDEWNMVKIDQIKDCSLTQAQIREQEWIDKLKPSMNSNNAHQTEELYKERKKIYDKKCYENHRKERIEKVKEYYEENKEKVKEYKAEYFKKNKEELAEKAKVYNEKNKEKIAETHAKYYQDNKEKWEEYNLNNKEKIAEINKTLITCECGCELTKNSLSRHLKSKKHINLSTK